MEQDVRRLSTGIAGLDEILNGGLLAQHTYLVRGGPGAGKTTLGLHFLCAGVTAGERVLYVTLGESEARLREHGERIGFDLRGVNFLDLSPAQGFFTEIESYDIFSPSEVERAPLTRRIVEIVRQLRPARVFIDSMTQFRYLATDSFQYRKQVLAFLRFLTEEGATVMFTSEGSAEAPDADLQFLCDGILNLDVREEMRVIEVSKLRGSVFIGGFHTYRIAHGGITVFPRLELPERTAEFVLEAISSGVPELDELLHGGLERGTVTLVTGPTGSGKTTLGLLFMKEAAGRGERSVVYTFEENVDSLLARSQAINIPVRAMMAHGMLEVIPIEPLRYTPDEFARLVRQEVEERHTRIVMLDSIAGYRLSMRGADLVQHLHALCRYLNAMGVTTLLVNEVEKITGEFQATELGISYLADNIIFLRYLEVNGELRKAIGVLKKRLSDFEKTLREYEITRYGVKVGRPLTQLRGLLSGVPEWKTS